MGGAVNVPPESQSSSRVRNITIIAHVDHGKTTLSDSLISAAGKLSADKAGKACVLDVGEAAARGITIESTAITLKYPANDLVVNLIDSPGHVEFNSQVTAALRITDGALLVVDVVEGCCVQTETVLRQALAERLRPVLVLNKVDRLLLDLQYTPEQMFDRCCQVIREVNAIIDVYQDPSIPSLTVSLEDGSVCLGSGYFGWMTHVSMVSDLYARSSADSATLAAIPRKLAAGPAFKDNFCRYVLQPIAHLHKLALSSSAQRVNEALARLGMSLDKSEMLLDRPRDLLRATMRRFMPAAPALLSLIEHKLPSPVTAQAYRVTTLYPPSDDDGSPVAHDSAVRDAIARCDPSGPVMMFVSKMVAVGKSQIALGRVFSGTLRPGMTVTVLPCARELHSSADGPTARSARIQRLVVVEGHSVSSSHEIQAGHLCGIVGLQDHLVKSGTVTTDPSARPFVSMKFSVSPIVRVAIRCDDTSGTGKLSTALQTLVQQDPCVESYLDPETHEHIVAGTGDLHLEVCVSRVRDLCPGISLKVSDALVAFREAVTGDSSDLRKGGCLAKSQNKHNRFWFRASALEPDLVTDLEASVESSRAGGSHLDVLQRHGWSKAQQRKVLVGGSVESGANVLVDSTVGVQYLAEARDNITSAFVKLCNEGPLSREKMRGIRIDLIDAKIHPEGAQRRGNQIVPACVRAMSAAILCAAPVLLEPIYGVNVQLPSAMVGTVHSVLSRRRGTVESYSERPGDVCHVKGFVPVIEAKVFTADIREQTHGKAFPSLRFSHWAALPADIGDRTIGGLRRRKNMDEVLPRADSLEDKM